MSDGSTRPSDKPSKKQRPSGLVCEGCTRRALGLKPLKAQASFAGLDSKDQNFEAHRLEVFQLKLRDWLGVERVEFRTCLSVCPSEGVTVERRGKTMVLDSSALAAVEKQFDPTRQLSLFDES